MQPLGFSLQLPTSGLQAPQGLPMPGPFQLAGFQSPQSAQLEVQNEELKRYATQAQAELAAKDRQIQELNAYIASLQQQVLAERARTLHAQQAVQATPAVQEAPKAAADTSADLQRVRKELSAASESFASLGKDVARAAEVSSQLNAWFVENSTKMRTQDTGITPSAFLESCTSGIKQQVHGVLALAEQTLAALDAAEGNTALAPTPTPSGATPAPLGLSTPTGATSAAALGTPTAATGSASPASIAAASAIGTAAAAPGRPPLQPRGTTYGAAQPTLTGGGATGGGASRSGSVEVGTGSTVNSARASGVNCVASTPVSPTAAAPSHIKGEMTARFEAARRALEPLNAMSSDRSPVPSGTSNLSAPPQPASTAQPSGASPPLLRGNSAAVASDKSGAASVPLATTCGAAAQLGLPGPAAASPSHHRSRSAQLAYGADNSLELLAGFAASPGPATGLMSPRNAIRAACSQVSSPERRSPERSSPSLLHARGIVSPLAAMPPSTDSAGAGEEEGAFQPLAAPPEDAEMSKALGGGLAPLQACGPADDEVDCLGEQEDQFCESPVDNSPGGTTPTNGLPRSFESFVIPMKNEVQSKEE